MRKTKYHFDVAHIQKCMDDGCTMQEIAEMYGKDCKRSLIYAYLDRNGYKVVEVQRKIRRILKKDDEL